MDFQDFYTKTIKAVFNNKTTICDAILKETQKVDYDSSKHFLIIEVSKPYVISLLKPKINELRIEYEAISKLPLKRILINDKEYVPELVKKILENEITQQKKFAEKIISKTNDDASSIKDKKNIDSDDFKYSDEISKEKTVSEKIRDDNFEDDEELKNPNLRMTFYNKHLGSLKTIYLNQNNLDYKMDFVLSAFFFFTLVIPMIFLGIGINKRKQVKLALEEVKSLLKSNYRPANTNAKKFMNDYLNIKTNLEYTIEKEFYDKFEPNQKEKPENDLKKNDYTMTQIFTREDFE